MEELGCKMNNRTDEQSAYPLALVSTRITRELELHQTRFGRLPSLDSRPAANGLTCAHTELRAELPVPGDDSIARSQPWWRSRIH